MGQSKIILFEVHIYKLYQKIKRFHHLIFWDEQVVALFAITGGLAVDFIRQDHPECLSRLVDGMADVLEDELVIWINENGGWV